MKTTSQNFPSGNYLYIKTETGQYAFNTAICSLQDHKSEIEKEIQSRQRRLNALNSVLEGNSVSDPAALN